MKQYLYLLVFGIIFMLIGTCRKNEGFSNQVKNSKEKFEPNCSSIYGKYNPRCIAHSKLYHVGYYNHRDRKYPILDIKKGSRSKGLNRFILLGKRIRPFSQKYWDKVFYFRKPFPYEKNIPYSFIFNFLFYGRIVNSHYDKLYYIFEKKMNTNLYKYVLFEHSDSILKYSFSLPDRNKINPGDTVFIRDRSSTLGPFTFIP